MPEFPPSGIPQGTSEHNAKALTPDAVSAVLADFRAWLEALTLEEKTGETPVPPTPGRTGISPPEIDLHTLLGQMVAVRQEVNLQTRAVRSQQEQNSEALRQLTAALDALRQTHSRGDDARHQAPDEVIRPLLKTLVDLYDALARAGSEMQRMSETILPSLGHLTSPNSETKASPSLWSRLFHSSFQDNQREERDRMARDAAERVQQLLLSLVTGYTMSLQRVERALQQHGLEPVPTSGERFDPERMEVVEAVAGSGRPSGEVIEEVRRGYLWNGRVFRYAQVRVAKG